MKISEQNYFTLWLYCHQVSFILTCFYKVYKGLINQLFLILVFFEKNRFNKLILVLEIILNLVE